MKKSTTLIFVLLFAAACTKHSTSIEPYQTTASTLSIPKKFPTPIIPFDNPLTVEGILLGRYLFYDNILSTNGRSCSSCHMPEYSFSSPLFINSKGEHISVPAHINLAWDPDYTWNGSVTKMDILGLADFGPEFFNSNMPQLTSKLKAHSKYPSLFKQAYNIDDIGKLSSDELQLKIVYAISQFLRTLISSESKFDKWMRHEVMFTEEEMLGYEIFFSEKGDCFHCHDYPLMTSNTYNNNGLDSLHKGQDLGRYLVSGFESDKGKFSVPTLRNIVYTAPYMHDGRFKSLEEVIDFYDSGVHWNSPNIDPLMTKSFKKYGLNLSPVQKNNLLQFLKTLSDTSFLNNKAFKKPVD